MSIAIGANQAYKKYRLRGGALSFKEFINAEKQKTFSANGSEDELILVNRSLSDSLQTAIDKTLKQGGLRTTAENKTVFGINKFVFIGGSILLVSAFVLLLVKQKK